MPRHLSLATAALLALAACRAPSDPDLDAQPPRELAPTSQLPLAVSARVTLDDPPGTATAGPPGLLRGIVTLRNPGTSPVTVTVSPCDPVLRAWPDSARAGGATLELPGTGTTCVAEPRRLTVAPGGIESLESAWSGGYVTGQLPEGRYWFTATARIDGRAVTLDAGSVEVRSGLFTIAMSALSSIEGVAPASLVTRATLRNTGPGPVRLEYSSCNVTVWAYRSAARTGAPAWKSEHRKPPKTMGDNIGYACTQPLIMTDLAPGATISAPFSIAVPTYEVLADSLPEGRYYLVANVYVNWRTSRVDAGEVVISRAQAPLPSTRVLGGLTFGASSRVVRVGGVDSLELTLTVTNGDTRSHTVAEAANVGGCHTNVGGYDDQARRDGYYLYRNADWTPPTGSCPFTIPAFTLAPGATRTFRGTVAAPPRRVHLALWTWLDVDGAGVRPDLSAGSAP